MLKMKWVVGIVFVLSLAAGALFMNPATPVAAQDGLTPGTPVEGVIEGDAGVSYTIDASAGQLILISMESDEFDAYLTIADASGTELAYDDDSGSSNNALLAFVVQADGTFTVTAEPSWSGSGAYTLTPNVVDPVMVELNGSVTLTPGAEDEVAYAVFLASPDTVVDVWASTQGEDDVTVELIGADASSIEYDDDDGPVDNALLRRVVLTGEGYYLVKIGTAWSDTPFTGPVDVAINVTERLYITGEPHTVVLSEDDLGTEVFTFEAALGTVYRITAASALNTGVEMELLDTGSFFNPNFETGNAVKAVWEYQSDVAGLVRINAHPSFFSDGDELTFTIETVE